MKDKLREFLKTGTRKTVMRGESGRYPNGDGWGHSWNEEVVEFNAKKLDAAILDAEGDGGAVGGMSLFTGTIGGVHVGLHGTKESVEALDAYLSTKPHSPDAADSGRVREVDYTPGELDRTAPARIWLQIDTDGDNDERGEQWPGDDAVTWCSDSIGGLEVQYVRADLPALAAQPGESNDLIRN